MISLRGLPYKEPYVQLDGLMCTRKGKSAVVMRSNDAMGTGHVVDGRRGACYAYYACITSLESSKCADARLITLGPTTVTPNVCC